MNHFKQLLMLLGFSLTVACSQNPADQSAAPCSAERYAAIEAAIQSGDGMGHGPDIGSGEWKSVVEFKLGLRDKEATPSADATEWCDFIEQYID